MRPEKNSEALWAAITRFNLFPGEYWHDSWREELTARIGPGDPDSSSQPLWVRALSTTILRELRLHDRFDFEFTDRLKRLVLLDATTLHRLCLALVGLLVRNHLRLLVSRDDANLIQRCLGPDIHRLVLEWREPVPIAASPLSWSADWRSIWSDSDAWARRGVATLYSALPIDMPALHGRLRLKFPSQWPAASFSLTNEPEHRQLNGDVCLKVLSLIAPSWSWLFLHDDAVAEVAA
ncbi:SctK family type III secretion system sorting platform protein [Steroidobacter agaridevorans]|uniref:SctK family type III secretion system sorting platform protein n=1 Tax=Steroidobacter agaridevorans TaxID=2695856 RepID=UPI001328780D|nr:SctK family type III secretion system sorting platform protein [Steroidobacter agaridevorans]GFE85226.1 hypothetical protein GCM10011488_01800 [Steroidobacter agaridevorans]